MSTEDRRMLPHDVTRDLWPDEFDERRYEDEAPTPEPMTPWWCEDEEDSDIDA